MKKVQFEQIIREEVQNVLKEAKPLRDGMSNILKPLIGGMYEQFDEFTVQPKLINIEISPKSVRHGIKLYDQLVKNKEAIKNYLVSNGLLNCKVYLATTKYGFGGSLKVIITSKPKLPNVFEASEETEI